MFKYIKLANGIKAEKIVDNTVVAKCIITLDSGAWVISSWFVNKNYQHVGHGRSTLVATVNELYKIYGEPKEIKYVWNGVNSYVYAWLTNNFNAECLMGIAEMKYKYDDTWESHVYVLDKAKFLKYCRLG